MSILFGPSLPASVKNFNKHAVLDLIRFTPGGISRIELAKQLDLTRSAISGIIDDLLSANLVCEMNEKNSETRRSIGLEINPERGKVIGIDMGATHVNFILADFAAQVIREMEFPFDIIKGPKVCLEQVDKNLQTLLEEVGIKKSDIYSIGVGVPGPIVSEAGIVSAPPIMPGWDTYPIRKELSDRWGIPVSLNNDAELGALGEWAYGAGRGEHNLVYVKVGTGVGAGLLINGQIYRGSTGSAGEIGHITIDENGPLCSCGNRGCLEAFTGGKAIARKAIDAVRRGQRTVLENIKPIDSISAQDVIAAARRGDLVSQQIFSEAGSHLGTAIASLVNLFNPGIVVVGGGVAQIGDLLLEPIRHTVSQRSLLVASRAVRISAALLGRRSSGMGAVVQANSMIIHKLAEQT